MTWGETTVGAEFEVQLGKMLDSERNNGESKLYVGNRAVQWGRIDLTAAGHVPLTKSDQLKFRLRRGDLLVCEGGEVGRGAIWDYDIECYFQKAIHRLRTRTDYRPEVLLGLLELRAKSSSFADYVTQTSIAHLPKDKFLTLPIPSIPAADQERIVAVLVSANDLVASLERLIAKKRDIKQGMMQELLTGRTRLAGFDGPWVEGRLGALYERSTGTVDPRLSRTHEFQHFSIPAFDAGRRPVVETGASIDSVKFTVPQQAVLVSKLNPRIPRVWAPVQISASAVASTEFVVVTPAPGVNRSFLKWLMKSEHVAGRMTLLATGTTKSHVRIQPSAIADLEIAWPTSNEQQAIARVLDCADDEIAALERRLESTRAIKHGMMQGLLTGHIRLPITEEASA